MAESEGYAPVAAILQEMIGASETAARAEQAFAAAEEARDRAGIALNEAHGRLSGLQRQLVSAQQHRLTLAAEVVDVEIIEADQGEACIPRCEGCVVCMEAPAACTPEVYQGRSGVWLWRCNQHRNMWGGVWPTREVAEDAFLAGLPHA